MLETIVYIALMVASVSFTITTTSIFKWFRELVSPIHGKIEELIHCPYCLGHWITFAVLFFIYDYSVSPAFFLQAFAVMGLVAIFHYVILRAYEPVAKAMARRELEKKQNQ